MEGKYVGFDAPTIGENGFELFKGGKPYLSLYHDCRLTSLEFENGKFILTLEKVHNSGYGPPTGSVARLIFSEAKIVRVEAEGEGNFEDVNELTVLGQGSILRVKVSIGPMNFILQTKKLELSV